VCVASLPAAQCFISAAVVIEVSSIAAPDVVKKPAACNAARPTAAMNKASAWKGVSIIASANANIASA